MLKKSFTFTSSTVLYYFDADFSYLHNLVHKDRAILIVDANFAQKNKKKLNGWRMITIPSGEQQKVQATIDNIVDQLIAMGADKTTILIGVGGGVVTDMTGYVASIFLRGVQFAFVPTTVLAMTDAAIGGKNGINIGLYKNMVGLIRQPLFILYDYSLLRTLPKEEWVNGFAEVIKHACIHDAAMFSLLEAQKITYFQKDLPQLAKLIQRNVLIKTKTVQKDEFETGERKLLNFGHTIGHAIENLYHIPHGHAVSIGIGVACKISEQLTGFKQTDKVISLLRQYGLPPQFSFDKEAVWQLLLADKKISTGSIHYVVLNKIGKASTLLLPLEKLQTLIQQL